jgi:hypothetical protein
MIVSQPHPAEGIMVIERKIIYLNLYSRVARGWTCLTSHNPNSVRNFAMIELYARPDKVMVLDIIAI